MKKSFLKPRNGRLKKIMGELLFNEKTNLMIEALSKINSGTLNDLELMRAETFYTNIFESIKKRLELKGYTIKN